MKKPSAEGLGEKHKVYIIMHVVVESAVKLLVIDDDPVGF